MKNHGFQLKILPIQSIDRWRNYIKKVEADSKTKFSKEAAQISATAVGLHQASSYTYISHCTFCYIMIYRIIYIYYKYIVI